VNYSQSVTTETMVKTRMVPKISNIAIYAALKLNRRRSMSALEPSKEEKSEPREPAEPVSVPITVSPKSSTMEILPLISGFAKLSKAMFIPRVKAIPRPENAITAVFFFVKTPRMKTMIAAKRARMKKPMKKAAGTPKASRTFSGIELKLKLETVSL